VAASYVDPPPPQLVTAFAVLASMTDLEYLALMNFANTNATLHRIIHQTGIFDLNLPAHQALIQSLSPAVLTAARSTTVFAAMASGKGIPPLPSLPVPAPMQPLPPPKPINQA
jgi:hypothetical protein